MSNIELAKIEGRFKSSVETAFVLLHSSYGFAACDMQESDISDIRDAMLSCVYVRDAIQVEVRLTLSVLHPAVYLRRFARAASCSVEEQPLKVIALEHFAQVNRPRSNPPLPWMRTATLYEEVAKSYRRYSKNMSVHLEDAISYLASLLDELMPQLLREVQD